MNWFMSTVLILLSAYFDAKGFHYAGFVWDNNGSFMSGRFFYSFFFFMFGILLYLISIRFFVLSGVNSSTLQTIIWFGATIIGVSIFNGDFKQWDIYQYIAFFFIFFSMIYLLVRH